MSNSGIMTTEQLADRLQADMDRMQAEIDEKRRRISGVKGLQEKARENKALERQLLLEATRLAWGLAPAYEFKDLS